MTYQGLQNILKVMLIGDNAMPKDDVMLLAILEMAYIDLSNKCTALKLLTASPSDRIIREGYSGTYVRMPELPDRPDSVLDIDMELVPAVARIMASYISKDKVKLHLALAAEIIAQYESKVRGFMLGQEQRGKYADIITDEVFGSDGTGVIAVAEG